MGTPAGIALEELLPLLADPVLRKNLVNLAVRRSQDADQGRDFAHQAMKEALETRAASWSRESDSFLLYLGSIVNRRVWNWRRKASTRLERPLDKVGHDGSERGDADAGHLAAHAPSPDDALDAAAEHARADARFAELEARLRARGDELALAIVACEDTGMHKAADQAAKLDCPVADVYRARERIAGHLQSVLRAEHARESEAAS